MIPGADAADPAAERSRGAQVVLVDLNNFATFPTLAIGLLVAALRGAGSEVRVMCPLAHDVPAALRERRETWFDHLKRRVHLSTWPLFRLPRDAARALRMRRMERPHPTVLREVARALRDRPDIILLSAYLQHFRTVREIGRLAGAAGVPVLVGGPMFNLDETAGAWRALPGITAVVGAEADHLVIGLVDAVREGRDIGDVPGVMMPDGRRAVPAAPLRDLDRTPVPDYTDFPWDRYPVRIVPLMTGRGCQWDKCLFCSDVISVSGRTFRTRSVESVLLEMQEQARRHETTNFLFLDLKLNSWPGMLRGLGARAQVQVPGAEWVGTVHVDRRPDNGLSRRDLELAVAGGMRRISFGLESGSQRLLNLMRKGSTVEGNEAFIRDAHSAGLSVRCTMFKGFPGETAEDMAATVRFLERNVDFLDRVRFNEFSLMQGTPIHRIVAEKAGVDGVAALAGHDPRRALTRYSDPDGGDPIYRRAKARALDIVFAINRRPLRSGARQFDGLM